MPNALTMRSLPPAVEELSAPEETTPGTYVITTREGSARSFRHIPIAAPSWHEVPRLFRARSAVKLRGGWAALTSEVESDSELRQELLSYACLDENWDGDGAKPPSQEAVDDSLIFLDGKPCDIPPPYPEEGTEGDVGIYWDFRDAQVFAEVTFEGDGTYAYFAVRGVPEAVAEKYGSDGVDVVGPWPTDLLRILRSR